MSKNYEKALDIKFIFNFWWVGILLITTLQKDTNLCWPFLKEKKNQKHVSIPIKRFKLSYNYGHAVLKINLMTML